MHIVRWAHHDIIVALLKDMGLRRPLPGMGAGMGLDIAAIRRELGLRGRCAGMNRGWTMTDPARLRVRSHTVGRVVRVTHHSTRGAMLSARRDRAARPGAH